MVLLMIVHDLHLAGAVLPPEDDAPLIIDADRMISLEAAFERLQPVPRRLPQIEQSSGGVKVLQLSLRHLTEIRRKPLGHPCPAVEEQIFGKLAAKGDNHVIGT